MASIAALLGDPARANRLTAMMDGRALTVSELAATAAGRHRLSGMGIEAEILERGRRKVRRPRLDWSERRGPLGGVLGAALLQVIIAGGWANPRPGRVLAFTPAR